MRCEVKFSSASDTYNQLFYIDLSLYDLCHYIRSCTIRFVQHVCLLIIAILLTPDSMAINERLQMLWPASLMYIKCI